jgi:hypothetical protein
MVRQGKKQGNSRKKTLELGLALSARVKNDLSE